MSKTVRQKCTPSKGKMCNQKAQRPATSVAVSSVHSCEFSSLFQTFYHLYKNTKRSYQAKPSVIP